MYTLAICSVFDKDDQILFDIYFFVFHDSPSFRDYNVLELETKSFYFILFLVKFEDLAIFLSLSMFLTMLTVHLFISVAFII